MGVLFIGAGVIGSVDADAALAAASTGMLLEPSAC